MTGARNPYNPLSCFRPLEVNGNGTSSGVESNGNCPLSQEQEQEGGSPLSPEGGFRRSSSGAKELRGGSTGESAEGGFSEGRTDTDRDTEDSEGVDI